MGALDIDSFRILEVLELKQVWFFLRRNGKEVVGDWDHEGVYRLHGVKPGEYEVYTRRYYPTHQDFTATRVLHKGIQEMDIALQPVEKTDEDI